jgi:hypothetical protein
MNQLNAAKPAKLDVQVSKHVSASNNDHVHCRERALSASSHNFLTLWVLINSSVIIIGAA